MQKTPERENPGNQTSAPDNAMELLYIWIEEDETGFIRKQGFNFSPNFHFEMKACEDGKYALFCTEKPDYPNVWKYKNIVNLTAVVGENGSGKSALLRHLANGFVLPIGAESAELYPFTIMLQIYRFNHSAIIVHNYSADKIVNKTEFQTVCVTEQDFQQLEDLMRMQNRIFITNTLSSVRSQWESTQWESVCSFMPVVFSPAKNNQRSKDFFRIKTGQEMAKKLPERFLFLQKQIASHRTYEDFERIAAVSCYHQLHLNHPSHMLSSAMNKEIVVGIVDPKKWFLEKPKGNVNRSGYARDFRNRESLAQLLEEFFWWKYTPRSTIYWDPVYALYFLLKIELCFLMSTSFENFPNNDKAMYENLRDQIACYKESEHCDNNVLAYYESALWEISKLEDILSACCLTDEFSAPYFITNSLSHCKKIKPGSAAHDHFCEFIDTCMKKDTSFVLKYLIIGMLPLSSGEQALQNIFSWLRMPPSFEKILGEESVPIADNILLLLDEVDLYMHPEWQRKYLKYLSDELAEEYKDKHIQIIISTHSPLVLSDIPSGNIIYLEKNDKKCTIAQRDDTNESFGANIYSLLKDSFFLKRSLGEFAYSRISDLIKALEELEKNPDNPKLREECRQLISIIGEPILRRKLQMMYDDIFKSDTDAAGELALKRVEQLLKTDAGKYRERLMKMLSDAESE